MLLGKHKWWLNPNEKNCTIPKWKKIAKWSNQFKLQTSDDSKQQVLHIWHQFDAFLYKKIQTLTNYFLVMTKILFILTLFYTRKGKESDLSFMYNQANIHSWVKSSEITAGKNTRLLNPIQFVGMGVEYIPETEAEAEENWRLCCVWPLANWLTKQEKWMICLKVGLPIYKRNIRIWPIRQIVII